MLFFFFLRQLFLSSMFVHATWLNTDMIELRAQNL